MKVILSRKGFDSQSGGIPNLILPNGDLLVFPIPSEYGDYTYQDISYGEKTYYEILSEINPRLGEKLKNSKCHIDPDIQDCYCQPMENWKPAFGQCGISQKHLEKENIGIGDVFLFFAWFRQTEYKNGRLQFVSKKDTSTYDKHIIYGYMEIGQKLTDSSQIKNEYKYHPHADEYYLKKEQNTLYLPSEHFSMNSMRKGYGKFNYSSKRQLTKENHSRSEWNLPDCFKDIRITYHENDSYGWIDGNDYFKSASRGQEFVVEANNGIIDWVKEILIDE